MNKRVVDYELEVAKRLLENVEEVRESVRDKDMQLKITNYANKHGLSKGYVEQRIVDDIDFARNFAKDPGRQSIHETIAAKHIEELPVVKEHGSFKKLPAGGRNAKYVTLAGVRHENQDDTKSIDFEIKIGDETIYATCKYTKGEGGAQDNQYADVKQYVNIATQMLSRGANEDNERFIAIVDGAYYENHGRKKELRRIGLGHIPILSINEVEEYLELYTIE